MNIIDSTRKFMNDNKCDYLLINSCNEYLEEYTPLDENARYKLTGFSGSSGDAIVSRDKIYLFVDGRYHQQADLEVDKKNIVVIKMKMGETFLSCLNNVVNTTDILGVFSKKVSQARLENLEKICNIKLLNYTSIERVCEYNFSTKIQTPSNVSRFLKQNEAILVSNLDEISYLFNARDFSLPYSSKIHCGKVLITKKTIKYYKNEINLNDFPFIKTIYADKSLTNAFDYKNYCCKKLITNPVKEAKAIKSSKELSSYKKAFKAADKALLMTRNFIENNDFLSEFDIEKNLEENFYKTGALGLSFKSIIAKDKNSALAHYSKNSKNEILKEGSLILIDCGAYYQNGLATDATRVFVKGNPTDLQKEVYTKVLKSFLKAFNYKVKQSTSGFLIDKSARNILNVIKPQGFEFSHGLGHGIGISVHELPPNLSPSKLAKTKLKPGMCFTIEPGLYNPDVFGMRLENSCYLDKNYVVKSFSNMPFENKLIDYNLLTATEKKKLKQFKVI